MLLYVADFPFQMPPKGRGGKGRAPAKRQLAEEFPPGEVLTDTQKRSWKLGHPVGQGGFGLIYLGNLNAAEPSLVLTADLTQIEEVHVFKRASFLLLADENSAKPVGADARYVVKVVRGLPS